MLLVILGGNAIGFSQAASDEGSGDANTKGKITGRVVNESGQPLAGAVVSIRGYTNSARELTLITDAEGNFQATNLAPLAYLISVSAPAYVSAPRDPDLNPIGYYRIGDSVRLEMIKGGVITGTVKRSSGEALVSVQVRAYMLRDSKGQPARYSLPVYSDTTDDRGVYRVYGLPPGTYIVSAGGSGYGMDPYANDVPTYAPSSTRDAATEISVNAGADVADVDIRYRDEPGHMVSGSANGPASDNQQGFSIVLSSIFNGVAQTSSSTYQERSSRGFMFTGVADGDYDLIAQTYSPAAEWQISESRRIKVRGADVTGVELNVKPLSSINGTIVLEESKAPECQGKRRPVFGETVISPWHNETIAPRDQPQFIWSRGGPTIADDHGGFSLRNLAAGQYRFNTRPMAKYWYLKSIAWPSAGKAAQVNQPPDAARNWTTVKSGERLSGLTITFAAGAASLQGRVEGAEGQKISARLFVYLAPAERDKAEDILHYFVSLAAEDGSFMLSNVPPGHYWVIAKAARVSDSNMVSKLRLPDENELRTKLLHDGEAGKIETELKPCQNLTDYRLAFKE